MGPEAPRRGSYAEYEAGCKDRKRKPGGSLQDLWRGAVGLACLLGHQIDQGRIARGVAPILTRTIGDNDWLRSRWRDPNGDWDRLADTLIAEAVPGTYALCSQLDAIFLRTRAGSGDGPEAKAATKLLRTLTARGYISGGL